MENRFYLLLKHLYYNYDITPGVSLNSLIKDEYKKELSDFNTAAQIKGTLIDLEKRGIIEWGAEPTENRGGGFKDPNYKMRLGSSREPKQYNFENLHVEAWLTYTGWEYANNIITANELRNSNIQTNASGKGN